MEGLTLETRDLFELKIHPVATIEIGEIPGDGGVVARDANGAIRGQGVGKERSLVGQNSSLNCTNLEVVLP